VSIGIEGFRNVAVEITSSAKSRNRFRFEYQPSCPIRDFDVRQLCVELCDPHSQTRGRVRQCLNSFDRRRRLVEDEAFV
jgi:hypothetical protein